MKASTAQSSPSATSRVCFCPSSKSPMSPYGEKYVRSGTRVISLRQKFHLTSGIYTPRGRPDRSVLRAFMSGLSPPWMRRNQGPGSAATCSRPLSFSSLILFTLLCLLQPSLAQTTYKIGAIIPNSQPDVKVFLQYTIEKLNSGNRIFPGSSFELLPIIKEIDPDNAFQTSIQACSLLEEGVVAIFAPPGKNAGAAMQSFGDMFEVPIIHYSPQFQSDSPASFYINLYPHYSTINRIMFDIVQYYQWNQFAILYETEDGLRQMEDLLRLPKDTNTSYTAWKVRIGSSPEERELLVQNLKEFRDTKKRVIIDCHPLTLITLLNTMKDLQMLTEYHHYIFTSFQLTEYYLSNYTQGDMNITVFKLINYDSLHYQGLATRFKLQMIDQLANLPITYIRNQSVSLEMALLYDAVYVLQKSLAQLQNAAVVTPRSMSCKNPQMGWENGLSLMNFLRMKYAFNWEPDQVSIQGITGSVAVNGLGQRIGVHVTIMERRNKVPIMVGNWTNRNGINITQPSQISNALDLLVNKTIRVTTIISAPFTQLKVSDEPLEGNDRFEGYCIDLLKEMKDYMEKNNGVEFKYVIHQVADGRYGSHKKDSPDGAWDGMVGELMENKADLAVAPLTINFLRQDVIDFSTPFMNLGISILYRMQESKTPSIFSFLKPLHYDIWMYLIVSYIAISMVLFIMARFTPYEWYRPNDDSDEVENQFTLINSLWFSAGAMMQQGSEISPRALSTRVISAMWYLTTIIVVASYTANLAAFLTVTRMETPIANADDLVKQTEIKYGAVQSGTTAQFFKDSDIATNSRMWQFMSNQEPSVFVATSEEGINRVMKEDYAFLMESVMIEYIVSQKCNLTQIGNTLDSKFYGIGLQKNSPYTPLISKAILQMQDEGVLVKLKKKWWKDQSKCVKRESGSGADDASSLKLDSIGGIFYVLIFGTLLGCLIAVMEFVWKSKKNASKEKLPLWKEMLNELAFAFRCRDSSSTVSASGRQREQINFKSLPSNESFPDSTSRLINNYSTPPLSSSALNSTLPHTQNHISSYHSATTPSRYPVNGPPVIATVDQVDPPYTPNSTYATYRPYAYHSQPSTLQSPPPTSIKFAPETPSILKNPSNPYMRVDTKV